MKLNAAAIIGLATLGFMWVEWGSSKKQTKTMNRELKKIDQDLKRGKRK